MTSMKEDASVVVPLVMVVLEGRAICHWVSPHKHASYDREPGKEALGGMFVQEEDSGGESGSGEQRLDLSNSVWVLMKTLKNDLLLAGDNPNQKEKNIYVFERETWRRGGNIENEK